MDAGTLALSIPIIAIVLGIGSDIVKRVTKSQERRLELRLQAQQGQSNDVTRQIEALRAEIAGLRDTSTQFDMSLEHTVQRIEERVGRIETKASISSVRSASVSQSEETQQAGLR